jgi:serine/threonine protein kinase/WD40 repeat protein
MSDGPGPEERRAPPGEATPASQPTVPPGERTGPYQPPPDEAWPQVPGYEVLGELGRGGMGVVYQARQVGLDRLVALKVVLAGAHADAEDLVRFRREAEAIARLRHPNVVEIYEIGEQGSVPHFSMELCPSGSLAQKLSGGPLAPPRAAEVVETLARAVQAAHEAGVIHRDLKPANVLLAEDGTPKITDFGLAKRLDSTPELTATGAIVGTPSYMAPEQASGDSKRVGPAADVYALGAILYACLTGRPPFRAATQVDTLLQVLADPPVPPSGLRPGIPADLEAICLRCLEKKPGRRFAGAAELADALRHFLDGQPASVRPRDNRRRKRLPRFIVGGCLWAGVMTGIVTVWVIRMDAHVLSWWLRLAIPPFAFFFFLVFITPFLRQRYQDTVNLLVFSPDGSTLASMNGRTVELWDVTGERLRVTLTIPFVPLAPRPGLLDLGDRKAIRALAFTPNGQTLVTLDWTGCRLWNAADGRPTGSFPLHTWPLRAAAFGPDCRTLATVTGRISQTTQTLSLWDLDLAGGVSRRATVLVPSVLGDRDMDRGAIGFTADGHGLALFTRTGLKVWDVDADGLRERPVPNLQDAVATPGGKEQFQRAALLGPDVRLVALLDMKTDQSFLRRPTLVTVWDVAADRACCQLFNEGPLRTVLAFAPDGRVLAGFGWGDGGRLWDLRTGRPLVGMHRVGGGDVTAAAFSPDGRTLAVMDTEAAVDWLDVDALIRAGRQRLPSPAAPGAESPTPPSASPGACPPSPATVPAAAAEAPRPSLPTLPPAPTSDTFPEVPGYEVLEELGRGGMGVVYLARQVGLDRVVALKVLPAGAHAGPEERARFWREAEAIARLDHPNVVHVYEVGEHNGLPYFSMELCAGGSLARRLAGGALPPEEAARLTAALARAVHAAHEVGVIHRDLKPANVLLAGDGTPKLTDFGLAKQLDAATGLTASGVVLGTPSYMAPEQAGGRAQEVGPAADVYALGAVLYACLTGRPPFQAATPLDTVLQVLSDPPVPPSQLRRRVPAALEAICLKCLEKEPRRRYASAAALDDHLERALAGSFRARQSLQRNPQREAWRTAQHEQRRHWRRMRVVLWVVGGGALSTAIGVVGLMVAARFFDPTPFAILFGIGIITMGFSAFAAWHLLMAAPPRMPKRPVPVLAFRPDGRALAVGRGDGSLCLVDLDSEEMRVLDPGGSEPARPAVRALAFRRGKDGEKLAVLDAAGAVRLWDLTTPRKPEPILAVKRVTTAAFSPDGRWLAALLRLHPLRQKLRLWDLAARHDSPCFETDAPHLWALTFAPAAPAFAAMTSTGLRVYRLEAGGRLSEQTLAGREVDPEAAPAFTPDGRSLVVRLCDGSLGAWEVATGRPQGRVRGPAGGRVVVHAPDGRTVATLNADGTASLWDVGTGQELGVLAVGAPPGVMIGAPGGTEGEEWADLPPVRLVVFSPDGRRVALADACGDEAAWAGGSLARRIGGRPQPVHQAAELVAVLARGVQAAHGAGVIHRDLKPGNVLLHADGTPKIADFGLARKLDGGTGLTQSGVVMGTPSYMAPEQASGAKDVGPAADVWALGAVLYELLIGRPPFRAATAVDTLLQMVADPPVPPSRLRAGIPRDLEAVCLRCLEKDPRRRPGSAAALARDLERFLAGGGQSSERPPRSAPAPGLRARALAFRPDGHSLAVGFADGSVRLYDLVTDEVRGLVPRSPRKPTLLAPALGRPRDRKAALVPPPPGLVAWALRRRDRVIQWRQKVPPEQRPAACALAFVTIDGRQFVAGLDASGELKLWDPTGDREPDPSLEVAGTKERVTAAAFSPCGGWLAVVIGPWSLRPEDSAAQHSAWHFCRFFQVRPRQAVRLWDLSKGKELVVPGGIVPFVWEMTFSWDASGFTAATSAGMKRWTIDRARGHVEECPLAPPAALGPTSPDGRTLATRNANGTVSLWAVPGGEELAVLAVEAPPTVNILPAGTRHPPEGRPVVLLAFAPDGRTLALADDQGGVAWCDVALTIRAGRFGAGTAGSSPGGAGSL